jgi:hypothetical protein
MPRPIRYEHIPESADCHTRATRPYAIHGIERSLDALLSGSPLRSLEFGEEGERSPVRDIAL